MNPLFEVAVQLTVHKGIIPVSWIAVLKQTVQYVQLIHIISLPFCFGGLLVMDLREKPRAWEHFRAGGFSRSSTMSCLSFNVTY